jgi:hypothetical protein
MKTSRDRHHIVKRSNGKSYSPPRLTRFGKVRALTAGGSGVMVENGGMGNMPGGGGMGPNRRP